MAVKYYEKTFEIGSFIGYYNFGIVKLQYTETGQIGFIAGHTNLFTTLPGHSEIADPVGGGTCR